ncbi:hypothetical protein LTR17_002509 [Elasticomyces elasticus]|nr:hypothetical protein LTR17_002509 [Elasticomyces elasticus]
MATPPPPTLSDMQLLVAAINGVKEAVSGMSENIQGIYKAAASFQKLDSAEKFCTLKLAKKDQVTGQILRNAQTLWPLLDGKRKVNDGSGRTYMARTTPSMTVRVMPAGPQFFAIVTRNAFDGLGNHFTTPQILYLKATYAPSRATALDRMLGLTQEILAQEAPMSLNRDADWVEVGGYGTYNIAHKGDGRDNAEALPQPFM